MAMHVRTEGDKPVVSSAKFGTFANVVESKPHIIIIFHLKLIGKNLKKTSRKWVSNPYVPAFLIKLLLLFLTKDGRLDGAVTSPLAFSK